MLARTLNIMCRGRNAIDPFLLLITLPPSFLSLPHLSPSLPYLPPSLLSLTHLSPSLPYPLPSPLSLSPSLTSVPPSLPAYSFLSSSLPSADQLLHPKGHPVLCQPKAHKFYALDPSHRVSYTSTFNQHN